MKKFLVKLVTLLPVYNKFWLYFLDKKIPKILYYIDNYFVHENYEISLKEGDVVYYWLNVITTTGGYNLLEQSWTASSC